MHSGPFSPRLNNIPSSSPMKPKHGANSQWILGIFRNSEYRNLMHARSILLGNNACRSGNDRSPTLKGFSSRFHEGEEVPNVLYSVSCLLLQLRQICERAHYGTLP